MIPSAASTAMYCGWPEMDYQPLLDQLKELESKHPTTDLVIRIESIIGNFLEQKYEFARVNKIPKSKFIDFIFGVFQKICERTTAYQGKETEYLFWRICYLYINGIRSFAARKYEWDDSERRQHPREEIINPGHDL